MEKRKNSGYPKLLSLLLLLAAVMTFINIQSVRTKAADSYETGNYSRLVTNNNPDFYSVIETKGNKIQIRGVLKSDPAKSVRISGVSGKEDFHSESDGSYTAELEVKPINGGYYDLYIILNSGVVMTYQMKYTDGWYIPDNGLSRLNDAKLEKAYTAPAEAALYYLSANSDKAEAESALSQIKDIVAEVCGDETDDYKKAYLLNRWVADNIYYDHDAADTSVTLDTVAIYNVLERKRTTCAGYANTYSALLEEAGIRSVNIKGAAVAGEVTFDTLPDAGENHEFTAFWYEEQNRWVYADACWSGAGDYRDGSYTERITYDKYFDVASEAFSLNHRVDKVEERNYKKALETLSNQEKPDSSVIPENTDAATTDETAVSGGASNTTAASAAPPRTTAVNTQPESSGSGGNQIFPFVIIGLTGALIIAIGIILAVRSRKK